MQNKMMRLLLIAVPDTFHLPFEQFLVKKGYEVCICENAEDAKIHMQSGSFDTYIIEPFANFTLGAIIIKQLKEWKLLDRVLIVLPGLSPNEEITAAKIVGKNYFLLDDSFPSIEEKIVQVISNNQSHVNFPIFLHKPAVQYIKGEIEKAKRGRTSLSFIYYRLLKSITDPKEISTTLQKVNTAVNYRLRISDDAFPFKNGIFVLLFGTHAQDRYIIANAIQKRVRRALKSANIDYSAYFELAEATYPDDGNSFTDILSLLDSAKPKTHWKENATTLNIASEIFKETTTPQNSFRLKRKLKEIEATGANTFLNANYLPPTWFGALLQMCNDEKTTPRLLQEFILNETNIADRLLQLSSGLISLFPERYHNGNNPTPQNLMESYLLLGQEEFKNLIYLCTLENSVLSGSSTDLSVLKENTFSQMATTLELSNKLDYQNKSELLLCAFCQAIGDILIKRKNPDKYFSIYEKQNSSNNSIGQLFFTELGFTPLELTWLFLNQWGIDESLIESTYCVRYENTSQLNPQLTAITHLSIVISNNISGLSNEKNLKLSKTSVDEILLRNRSFKPEDLNYLVDSYDQWLQKYSFLF
jgi:HD-like signal output (HDOD) protein